MSSTGTLTKWVIDNHHSEIGFKVKHLVISTTSGKFKEFSGSIETDNDDFRGAKIEFTAKTESIDTASDYRDTHLKSADFFDAVAHPEVKFVSTDFVKLSDEKYALKGNLTLKGVTRPVELDVDHFGTTKDPFSGKTKAGFEVNGKIKRKDFGLTWDVLTEAGGAVVSDDVKLHIHVEADKVDA
jgi:polyisoprenoid-binding protein YceI